MQKKDEATNNAEGLDDCLQLFGAKKTHTQTYINIYIYIICIYINNLVQRKHTQNIYIELYIYIYITERQSATRRTAAY